MTDQKDKVPPVTDDVEVEILSGGDRQDDVVEGACRFCGMELLGDHLVGRCSACGKLFINAPSVS